MSKEETQSDPLNDRTSVEGALADAGDRRIRELDLLYKVSCILDQSLDLRQVVNPVLHALGQHLGMRHATLALLNRATGEITIEAAEDLSAHQTKKGRYRIGEGVTGRVVATGNPAIIPSTIESSEFLDRTGRGRTQDTSFVCVPITLGNEIIGTLSVDEVRKPLEELEADARLLEIVAAMISQAVRLRQEAQEARAILEEENRTLRQELSQRFRITNIIGNSREMQQVYQQIAQVARSPSTVFINGETGVGKELVAHAIHYNSDRADSPFVRVHCAALPEAIIESELFGHEKGAFTGASGERKGRFEMANGGTIFLDEIGEISPSLQIKLLRVLQEREFERVGGAKTIRVNVRIIAATNRDLLQMVREGKFREDLYYRLYVFPIYVPPLRNRKSDIMPLADHFLQKFAAENKKTIKRISTSAIDMLMAYHWPGNVRELENCMERAVLIANGDTIHSAHLPPTLQMAAQGEGIARVGEPNSLKGMVERYESDIISDALKSTKGNVTAAARQLDTTVRILGYKIKQYDIDPRRYSR